MYLKHFLKVLRIIEVHSMTDALKTYFNSLARLTQDELALVDKYFVPQTIRKKEYLLQEGQVCRFIAFITQGMIRHFHVQEGAEKTCDISLEGNFITDFKSFNQGIPSDMYFQAMENTIILSIQKKELLELYRACSKYETIGRMIAEQVAQRNTNIAMSLASDKPEIRFRKIIQQQPELFQRVPQRYIANLLGITPESLSRIRKRIYDG